MNKTDLYTGVREALINGDKIYNYFLTSPKKHTFFRSTLIIELSHSLLINSFLKVCFLGEMRNMLT